MVDGAKERKDLLEGSTVLLSPVACFLLPGFDAGLWKEVVLSSAAGSEEALPTLQKHETGTVPGTSPGRASPGPGVRDWWGSCRLKCF